MPRCTEADLADMAITINQWNLVALVQHWVAQPNVVCSPLNATHREHIKR